MPNAPATAEDGALLHGFEPETILPSQLFDTSNQGAWLQPEKRLMLAVLQEAVASFRRSATSDSAAAAREGAELRAWFASDGTSWPYTFLNICHVLGFEPDYFRRGLARWLAATPGCDAGGKVVPMRFAFRRISGSRTRAVVPRRLRDT